MLPAISIFEMREVVHRTGAGACSRRLGLPAKSRLHGLMAEFDTPEALLAAGRAAREAGYRDMDAYTPMPVEGLAEAIGFRSNGCHRKWSLPADSRARAEDSG